MGTDPLDPVIGGLSALASAAIWAFSATYMTAPVRSFGARATNLFKSSIAAALFLIAVVFWPGPSGLDAPPSVWGWFALSGICGLAVADSAYLTSLPHIGPTLTAVVYQASGIFTAALGASFLNERLSATEAVGIAVVIAGVLLALLATAPGHVERGHRIRGASWALGAAAFHAIGLVMNKHAFSELEAWNGTRGMTAALTAGLVRMSTAAVALLLLGAVTGDLPRQTRVFREKAGWRATFLPAFFGAFVAMVTMQVSLTLLKSGVASVLLAMTSIFTIPVEWKVLGRRPTVRGVAGAIVALAGVWLLVIGR